MYPLYCIVPCKYFPFLLLRLGYNVPMQLYMCVKKQLLVSIKQYCIVLYCIAIMLCVALYAGTTTNQV
jgi:hypothetical protein